MFSPFEKILEPELYRFRETPSSNGGLGGGHAPSTPASRDPSPDLASLLVRGNSGDGATSGKASSLGW